jgi:hypothetical protein
LEGNGKIAEHPVGGSLDGDCNLFIELNVIALKSIPTEVEGRSGFTYHG